MPPARPRHMSRSSQSSCSAASWNRFCCSLATAFPWVSVNLLLTWAYYVLVIDIGVHQFSGCSSGTIVVLGTATYLMCEINYFLIVRNGARGPPRTLQLASDDDQAASSSSAIPDLEAGTESLLPQSVLAKENGQQRFCSKCKCWKPDRTHHCSSCKKCVLKMDHHCPWFSTCIGFYNHKFFILFLLYVVLLCGMSFVVSGSALLEWIDTPDDAKDYISLNWVFLMVISLIFGIAVGVFLAYQLYLLFANKTTLEAMEPQRYKSKLPSNSFRYSEAPSSRTVGNVFDLGWRANFRQTMGDNPLLWFLPVQTAKGNGTLFPVNPVILGQIKRQAEQESQLLGNLQGYLARNSADSSRSGAHVMATSDEDEFNGRVSVEFRASAGGRRD
ncbi:DHHC palmitoyltransferase-domain-containing protein [Myxozyma melibiosi]|uniref:Palmitoyltransferase n=1 Tax=Myxozyma melibiosi TaxID=54550 RepID=A0ABR1F4R0_9ASCO